MTKHLVDLDDDLLAEARAELGTSTIKDTVNEALRRSSEKRLEQIADSLGTLAAAHLEDREAAWR
jgi:Arc/MetJ family transcription regulator